jgi:hypothetical protein
MAVEMEYKGEVVLVNPITSIVSIQHLRKLRYKYHIASSKRYDFSEDGENEKQKADNHEQQKNHELYLLRFEAAFAKGIRGNKFTKKKRTKNSRYEMQKRSRKINRGIKGRSAGKIK